MTDADKVEDLTLMVLGMYVQRQGKDGGYQPLNKETTPMFLEGARRGIRLALKLAEGESND